MSMLDRYRTEQLLEARERLNKLNLLACCKGLCVKEGGGMCATGLVVTQWGLRRRAFCLDSCLYSENLFVTGSLNSSLSEAGTALVSSRP